MAQVGQLYEEGEIFVPEMLVAARAMTAALGVLKPHLVEEGVEAAGTVAIGTVQGDLHDIGKNLVAMMLEGSGFEIMDLGVDVPAERFVQAVREGANVVAMSALLTTTMTNMQAIIQAITGRGAAGPGAHRHRRCAHHQDICGRDRGGRLCRGRLRCRPRREGSAGRLGGRRA